ncbi:MAG: chorismate synthase [Planctomycetota bacterium]
MGDPPALAERIAEDLLAELAARSGDPNTLGEIVRLTTCGESHGKAYLVILDGVPPGIVLSEADVQKELNRRRPGQSAVSTPRSEGDRVQMVSGVFEGRTTGAPIGMIIPNRDHDASRYDALRQVFRPGHADFTYLKKYGLRDHRGGGRSSGRETVTRVAGGAVARKLLAERGVRIVAFAERIAGVAAAPARVDPDQIERNPVRTADPDAAQPMEAAILAAKDQGDSVGGVVRLEVQGLPVGLGDPVFAKLDARLGGAYFSLGAVKGVAFGAGFDAADRRGSENNDALRDGRFVTNHAGGIVGGLSTGMPIVARIAVKPTPSVSTPQQACDTAGRNIDLVVEGRHDPCIVPRVIPALEAMTALVLLDAWEVQRRLRPGWPQETSS